MKDQNDSVLLTTLLFVVTLLTRIVRFALWCVFWCLFKNKVGRVHVALLLSLPVLLYAMCVIRDIALDMNYQAKEFPLLSTR